MGGVRFGDELGDIESDFPGARSDIEPLVK